MDFDNSGLRPLISGSRVSVTGQEFCERHGLAFRDFYPLVVKGLHLLPKVLRIGGGLRIFDVNGAKGCVFEHRARLQPFPKSGRDGSALNVDIFCLSYDLDPNTLLDLGLAHQLPMPYELRHRSDYIECVVDVDEVARWELARQADAAL